MFIKMRRCRGFTLVELMVAVTISAVLLALSVARFRDFNRSQIVKEAAKTLVSDLRMAQSKALSGQKPVDCDRLRGYSVTVSNDHSGYRIEGVCDNGPRPLASPYDTPVLLPANVLLSPDGGTVMFKVLGHGISQGSDVAFTVHGSVSENAVVVTVTPTGEIR